MQDKNHGDETALVFGVGPGLGMALARTFALAGMRVGIAARDGERLHARQRELVAEGADCAAYACDVTDADHVAAVFRQATERMGCPHLVVYNAGVFVPGRVTEISSREFQRCWRVGCLGGFHVGAEAARRMAPRGTGSVLFTGATASLRGGATFANLAVGKFGLRALAQSMARELGPQGIHVAHIIIDGQIRAGSGTGTIADAPEPRYLDPEQIAETYLWLHRQPKSAWTLELDLRPWVERF